MDERPKLEGDVHDLLDEANLIILLGEFQTAELRNPLRAEREWLDLTARGNIVTGARLVLLS
jgi:hypothetical protein